MLLSVLGLQTEVEGYGHTAGEKKVPVWVKQEYVSSVQLSQVFEISLSSFARTNVETVSELISFPFSLPSRYSLVKEWAPSAPIKGLPVSCVPSANVAVT